MIRFPLQFVNGLNEWLKDTEKGNFHVKEQSTGSKTSLLCAHAVWSFKYRALNSLYWQFSKGTRVIKSFKHKNSH